MDPEEMRAIPLLELGDRMSALRLRTPETLREMERSLGRHGQRTAIACFREGDKLEVADGLKRLHAARALGWPTLRAEVHDRGGVDAKLMLWHGNSRAVLTELEEAWVVRALYREDKLTQPRIAQLLGRHKSWVCRRLVLAEGLAEDIEADVRLGLLTATVARELGRLPRGNQTEVGQVIARRGLTTRQAAQLVDKLAAAPDETTRSRVLAEAECAPAERPPTPAGRPVPTPGERIVTDVAVLCERATRLHARLLERPLASLGPEVERIAGQRLGELKGVLAALNRSIDETLGPPFRLEEVPIVGS